MNWRRPPSSDWQPWLAAWLAAPSAPLAAPPGLSPRQAALLAAVAAAAAPTLEAWRDQQYRLGAEAATLHAVLDRLEAAILALDPEHRPLYANPAAARLWRLAPDPQARVTALARLPELAAALDDAFATGQPWRQRLQWPDGRHWDLAITALQEGAGCVLVARDVSESVRLETVRRDFVAALSHELRTPLTSIQGYAEILQQLPDLPAATRAEHLAVIVENTTRLSRLAQDLVLLSSLETGAYQFRFAEFDAAELAAPALAVLAPLAGELHCHLSLGACEPGRIRGDRDALHRVLLNLLENAMVHGHSRPAGSPPLEVSISGHRQQDDYLWRVRDNGPGIAAAEQARVFERFYQIGAGHTAGLPRRGAGLGLAVVKHVVHEHGGEASVESTLGQGSTFLVRLPLVQTAERP